MRKLAIIHFSPIELYPPALNLLNFLAGEESGGLVIRVFTLKPADPARLFEPRSGRISIRRPASAGKRGISAWISYAAFHLRVTLALAAWRPDTVLYYETLSAFPALFYKRYLKKSSSLFIHYHEYSTPEEYRRGMTMSRWFHRMERRNYSRAAGISQTNADRISLFSKDLAGTKLPALYALPNYPPVSWAAAAAGRAVARDRANINWPVRLVYVGALSLDTMYTREVAEWVAASEGKLTWDIYSDNITPDAGVYLASFDQSLIRFRQSVNYFSLPETLAHYDVGLILYKGHIPNYIYNAPNKLFEYLSCGLDVWFPDVMLGCYPYRTTTVYPKVKALDFTRLAGVDPAAAVDRTGLQPAGPGYAAETVYAGLIEKMKQTEK